MKLISFSIPGVQIPRPNSIPSGGLSTASAIFNNALTIMIIITIVLSLIYMVIAGIMWITSGGDKNKVQAARARMTWAIGGLIVALLAFAIVSLLGYLFGVNLLNFP